MDAAADHEKKFGFAAVIGAPNAGKSTLINSMVGAKVSIVSPKVQTTRTLVRGIALHENTQIVFVDTPGLFTPQTRLEKAMVSAAWTGREAADLTVLVHDASRKSLGRETQNIIDRLKREGDGIPCILALNKIDRVKRHDLLVLAQKMNALYPFAATFMISAEKADGTDDLLAYIAGRMQPGPWHYPEDQIIDMPARLIAAEITREKLFNRLHAELPHALTVETEIWELMENGDLRIGQCIIIGRESHKPIVLGSGGQMIKSVGEEARKDIEALFEKRAHLNLFVKVEENWTEDPDHYRMWDLDHKA